MPGGREFASNAGEQPFAFTMIAHSTSLLQPHLTGNAAPTEGRDRMALLGATIKNSLVALLLVMALAMPSTAATFSMKRGINLDNWATWPSEDKWGDANAILPFPEWRRTVGAKGLKALKADGFDFVRMPVDPAPLMAAASAGLRDRLMADVLASARLANAAGLNVVVDLHTIPWGDDRSVSTGKLLDDPALFERYLDMLREVASTLSQEDPHKVALELFNEPTSNCDAGDRTWPDTAKRLFAAARASATRLTLVIPGACWGNAEGLSRLDPAEFPDHNLIWTFHAYPPFLITHQGASWAGDVAMYTAGIPYPPDSVSPDELGAALDAIKTRVRDEAPFLRRDGIISYIDEQMALVSTPEKLRAVMEKPFADIEAWATAHGVEKQNIFLGEFGMIRQEYGKAVVTKPAWRAAYTRDMIAIAEKHGFAWAIWSYGGAFGVVETYEGEKAEPDVIKAVKTLPR